MTALTAADTTSLERRLKMHEAREAMIDRLAKRQGTIIPFNVDQLAERFDITKPVRINDTSKIKDTTLKFFAKALDTRSLLIIPITLNDRLLGLIRSERVSSAFAKNFS